MRVLRGKEVGRRRDEVRNESLKSSEALERKGVPSLGDIIGRVL